MWELSLIPFILAFLRSLSFASPVSLVSENGLRNRDEETISLRIFLRAISYFFKYISSDFLVKFVILDWMGGAPTCCYHPCRLPYSHPISALYWLPVPGFLSGFSGWVTRLVVDDVTAGEKNGGIIGSEEESREEEKGGGGKKTRLEIDGRREEEEGRNRWFLFSTASVSLWDAIWVTSLFRAISSLE